VLTKIVLFLGLLRRLLVFLEGGGRRARYGEGILGDL